MKKSSVLPQEGRIGKVEAIKVNNAGKTDSRLLRWEKIKGSSVKFDKWEGNNRFCCSADSRLTPGTNVKTLYFWFLMIFLGNFSSHFSGQPSHTVLAFSSFFRRHMWARQSQQLTAWEWEKTSTRPHWINWRKFVSLPIKTSSYY